VRGALGFGEEKLDPRAEKVFAGIPEHFFSPAIGQDDLADAIDADDPLGSGLEQGEHHRFAFEKAVRVFHGRAIAGRGGID
jgi:hypothetical protein